MDFSEYSEWISNEFHYEHFLFGLRTKPLILNNSLPGNVTEDSVPLNVSSNRFGITVTGLIILLVLGNKLKNINVEFLKGFNFSIESVKSNITAFLCLIIFLVIFPIIFSIFGFFLIFRFIVLCVLKLKIREKFIGLMEGTDCIWAFEDKSCLCIITGLGILEVPESETPFEIYHKIKERVHNRLFSHPIQYPKLFYKRKSFMGYFYWEDSDSINVDDYVRQIPKLGKTTQITKTVLDEYISNILNTPLYKNHTKSWEILIGKQSIENTKNNSNIRQYPIIFRVHHTLGDGYALVQLLLEAISETNIQMHSQEVLKKYTDFKNKKDSSDSKISSWENFMKVFYVPKLLFSQIIRKADENILHNNQLSGKKLVTWWSDNEKGEILEKLKRVKRKYSNVRFCDVIISAISVSFSKYFKQKRTVVPNTMTLVIPVRAEMKDTKTNNIIELTNRFTVGFVDAPLNSETKSLQQLEKVHYQTDKLRNSLEFIVNYWLIKILSGVLPSQILSVLLYSEHATAVASNIPGPCKIVLSNDMCLDDLIFWIPSRGRTGVGISILTYANRLQIGIAVDQIFISSRDEVKSILTEMIHEIENLDANTKV